MRKIASISVALALPVVLSACGTVEPEAAMVAAQPARMPIRPVTALSGSLACVSRLLQAQSPAAAFGTAWPASMRNVVISVGLVPDATGRLNPGLRDMIATAIASTTMQTGRYTFSEAYDIMSTMAPRLADTTVGGGTIGAQTEPVKLTGLQVVGSLSQADRGVQAQNAEAGVGLSQNTFGLSLNSDVSFVAIELRLVDLASRGVRANASNGLVLRNTSRAINADFKIGSAGINFEYSVDRREGPHQAVRTLIELSVAELIGKHANVDYWTCLSPGHDGPESRQHTANLWRRMSAVERDAYVRDRLRALSFNLRPAPAGYQRALGEFQQTKGMPATGALDYETFHALVTAGVAADQPLPARLPSAQPATPTRVQIDVAENQVAVGEGRSTGLNLQVTSDRTGLLFCYYRDERGRILRLAPNRFGPTVITPDQPVRIPNRQGVGAEAPFLIRPTRMTPDVGFLCVTMPLQADLRQVDASRQAASIAARLPGSFQVEEFQPVGARDFEEIRAAFAALAPGEAGTLVTTLRDPEGQWARLRPPFREEVE